MLAEVEPGKLSNKSRLLYEIEQLLEINDERLKIETVRKPERKTERIPNRDVYRIYKAILNYLGAEPRLVYTGKDIVELEDNSQKLDIEDMEPSL